MLNARRGVDILVCLAAFTSLLWVTGCVVSREVYVLDVKTAGIMDDLPVYVTDSVRSGEIRITPRVHIGTTATYTGVLGSHTKVNALGVFQVDTLRSSSGATYRETAGANQSQFKGSNFWMRKSQPRGISRSPPAVRMPYSTDRRLWRRMPALACVPKVAGFPSASMAGLHGARLSIPWRRSW